MVSKVKSFLSHPLISGSVVLFIGNMFANFCSYLYHLLMGRMLGPSDYGALTALISLIYLLSIFTLTMNTSVVKFVTKFKVKKDFDQIASLFMNLTKLFFVLGIVACFFFFVLQGRIAQFLNLTSSSPVLFLGVFTLFALLGVVNDGVLRGLLNFNFLAFNLSLNALIKVVLGVVLVLLGYSIGGALLGMIMGTVLTYFVSLWPLRFLRKYFKDSVKINWQAFFLYSVPVLIATLGLTSLYTVDIVLVKHFFLAEEAGLYASLSVMGKIVFLASSVISMVMFPLVSEKYEKGDRYKGLLFNSLGMVAAVSLGVTLLYFFLPDLMINILYGSSYLGASPYLGLFGIFITFYSLCSVLVNFFLSTQKVKAAVFPFTAAFFQILFIWFFHASIFQVIQISIIITTLLLVLLLLYFFKDEKKFSLRYRPGL